MTQDQFDSQFVKVKEGSVNFKENVGGATREGWKTEKGGYLVYGEAGVESFDTDEELATRYTLKK